MTAKPAEPIFDAAFGRTLEALFAWRRDVRHFRRDPLPDGAIDELLRIAQCAPSVGHSQPWRFVRITTPSLRAALADHADGEAARAGESYGEARRALYGTLKLHGLREAPEIVAVFCDEAPDAGHGLGAATMPETRRYSTVMAIHTMWLAARSRGIGLGWVSVVDPRWVSARIDVPPAWAFVALLCIGTPLNVSATPELEERGWQARESWSDHVSVR